MNLEELLQQLHALTKGKALGVHVFYIAGRGFLACLTDIHGEMIPQTTIWEYALTLEDACAGLAQIARAYGEA